MDDSRREAPAVEQRRSWSWRAIDGLLRVPLAGKIAGATLIIVGGVAWVVMANRDQWDAAMLVPFGIVLFGTLAIELVLVHLALRPLTGLEQLAEHVLAGNLAARARTSPLADRNVARLGRALNLLLDSLISERERMRRLAILTIRSQDEERQRLANELHESAAQRLAAISLEMGATAQEPDSVRVRTRLSQLRTELSAVVDDVRDLSQTVHPLVLNDLGPGAAIAQLGRLLSQRTGVEIDVDAEAVSARIPDAVALTLYRVARAALENVVRHAQAERVWVHLKSDANFVTMTILDDGLGFDFAATRTNESTGLFSMREWVSLLGGSFTIKGGPTRGTHITVAIPLEALKGERS